LEEWITKYEQARVMAGELMGAPIEATFFLPNVSTGINLASLYLRDRPVVLMETDFPSVILPWQTNHHPLEMISRSQRFYDDLKRHLMGGNKILSVSWVQSGDGFELDLDRVFDWCKAYNCTVVLDGTQGLGAIPFEVDPDLSLVFLSSSLKWLLAGYGVAIGYVSPDLLPSFKACQGWNSIDFGSGMAKTGAASLEVGNALFFNVLGLYEGLSMILGMGVEEICEKNLNYRGDLIDRLKGIGRKIHIDQNSRSTIFKVDADDKDYHRLVTHSVQTSKQSGAVRLSPHFYNDEDDIQKLLGCLDQ
jgi:selenocysteine lyase/cysteine desulfurase